MKIKIPPMPDPMWGGDIGYCYTPAQLAARDQQWLELVGPVVEALDSAIRTAYFEAHPTRAWHFSSRAALRAITEEQQ